MGMHFVIGDMVKYTGKSFNFPSKRALIGQVGEIIAISSHESDRYEVRFKGCFQYCYASDLELVRAMTPQPDFKTTREIQEYLLDGGQVIEIVNPDQPVYYLEDGFLNHLRVFDTPSRWKKHITPVKYSVELWLSKTPHLEEGIVLRDRLFGDNVKWANEENDRCQKKYRITVEEV